MLRAAIRQTLFHQNVLRENSPKFNDVKVSQYTVARMLSAVHCCHKGLAYYAIIVCCNAPSYKACYSQHCTFVLMKNWHKNFEVTVIKVRLFY